MRFSGHAKRFRGAPRTGYWKPDGDGMEVVAPREWAAALDVLAGGRERAFADATRTLLGRGNHALALKVADLGLIDHRESSALISGVVPSTGSARGISS